MCATRSLQLASEQAPGRRASAAWPTPPAPPAFRWTVQSHAASPRPSPSFAFPNPVPPPAATSRTSSSSRTRICWWVALLLGNAACKCCLQTWEQAEVAAPPSGRHGARHAGAAFRLSSAPHLLAVSRCAPLQVLPTDACIFEDEGFKPFAEKYLADQVGGFTGGAVGMGCSHGGETVQGKGHARPFVLRIRPLDAPSAIVQQHCEIPPPRPPPSCPPAAGRLLHRLHRRAPAAVRARRGVGRRARHLDRVSS